MIGPPESGDRAMILIGQYDSPFVRRVAIAMSLYRMEFEHRPWSTFADAAALREISPLGRVPTLVLDDGEALIESGAILDHLDETVGRETALIAASGPERRKALQIIACASGLADKAVSLFYERKMHERPSSVWVERCGAQIAGALATLEKARAGARTPWLSGERPSHADVMLGCVWRFLSEAHPGLADARAAPSVAAHGRACEDLPVFRAHSQPFIPPA